MGEDVFPGGLGRDELWPDPGKEGRQHLDSARLEDPLRTLHLRPVIRVTTTSSLADAIRTMRESAVGSCVVDDENGKLAGIITERNLLNRISLDGFCADEVTAGDFMQPDPESLALDHPIAYALNRMFGGGDRHIPIIDDAGRAVGVVTLRDIVDEVCDYFSEQVQCIPPRRRHAIASKREGA